MVELERAGALRAPARPHVIQVPRRDADGNAVGGVRLLDIAVLTGTKDGQNQPQTFTCIAGRILLRIRRNESATGTRGDGRPSIEERYRSRDDYVNRVPLAAQDLLARGFLLPEDAAVTIQAAASSNLLAPAANPAPR